ncbi:MAG: type IV pilus assembly protein PilM [Chlamydiae bacterium]|nr:type IV pilus assembly protein PilM [Chlamydiota bacterium]MBI3266047.1 type IV pilus assembly protein PilM [Chlamydiota bacterium]
MAQKNRVAVDIGSHQIKMAVFSVKGKKLTLTAHLVEEVEGPIDLMTQSATALVQKIVQMLAQLKIKTRSTSIYVSAPGPLSFCRLLKLPIIDRTKIRQIVEYEAQQQVPFSLSEVIWDYENLGNPDPEHLHILLTAARRGWIQELLQRFEEKKIPLEFLGISPLASMHCLRHLSQRDDRTWALLDIGKHSSQFIVSSQHTLWIRTLSFGGDHFTQEIQKETKLEFKEAQNLKEKKATLRPKTPQERTSVDEKLWEALATSLSKLTAELSRSIGFYETQFEGHPISQIYLTGGCAKLPGLEEALAEKLSLPVHLLNPFEHPQLTPVSDSRLQDEASLFATPIGLILQTLENGTLNLLPKSYIAQREIRKQQENVLILSLLGLAILGSQIFYHHEIKKVRQIRLAKTIVIQQTLEGYADKVKTLNQENQIYLVQIEEIKKLVSEKALWGKIFREFQKGIPPDIWLDKLTSSYIQKTVPQKSNPQKKGPPPKTPPPAPPPSPPHHSQAAPAGTLLLTLYCKTSGTYTDVAHFRETLDESPLFQNVQIRSANPPIEGVQDFVIQMEVEE